MSYRDTRIFIAALSIRTKDTGYDDPWRAEIEEYTVKKGKKEEVRYAVTLWDWYLAAIRVTKEYHSRGHKTKEAAEKAVIKYVDSLYTCKVNHFAVNLRANPNL